ncbi:hypothetical protein HSACCH_01263 [Halanaerobium saccharolyticum subsp. saccharolyticum DSM 6643]|uniref:Uncharacterized protein n=1 Tax=Halanaerobium saccharolyticum subsp. saccharolyticum DSM 6643 TaxID=1293054 RepID=M5E0U5_9FIRM|nr:hypothetical protein [Halanaerobium saccharolyticum]CCU79354.1 hypothetical protein HSACCH_01263 [Halanaerobium saccharolyticum subsp. saccharolyticum DSM 6643]
MLNNYYSVTIPAQNTLKNLVVKSKNDQIHFIDGINEISSIGKIKKLNYNCHYIILLPAASLFYHSAPLKEKNPYRISEDNILSKFAEVKENFEEEYYYDYLEIVSDQTKAREIKFFAADKKLLDNLTRNMDKYKNNYLISALPVAIFNTTNKVVSANNYLLYYKINNSYTILTAVDKKLDLLQASILENDLETEIDKTQKYYLNNKNINLKVLEGNSNLLHLEEFMELEDDDFVFLTAMLWSIDKCQ